MITILAEKPDMAGKIADAIGGDRKREQGFISCMWKGEETVITWAYGHLCGLKSVNDYVGEKLAWTYENFPYYPDRYETKVSEEKKSQFYKVKQLFEKSDLIISATDADREGDLIFYYIYTATGTRVPWKRLWIHSTEPEGLKSSLDNLKRPEDVQNIMNAGRCRDIADWTVGINLTVLATKKYSENGLLSVGRVQTPTLALLVQRENDIKNFIPKPFYKINGFFKTASGEEYSATLSEEKISDEAKVKEIMSAITGKSGVVTDVQSSQQIVSPPNLYNQNTLQAEANSLHGFTLKKTLSIAQSLYEKGYTTYPRVDSRFLPEDMKKTVAETIEMLKNTAEYGEMSMVTQDVSEKIFNDKKVSSHFAIIPTTKKASDLTEDESRIYQMIVLSLLRTAYPSAIYEKSVITTTVADYQFITKGSILKNKGWLALGGVIQKDKMLPNISKGEAVSGEFTSKQNMTKPPKHYTERTLLIAMVKAIDRSCSEDEELTDKETEAVLEQSGGIGTPATRADIVETLKKREYVYTAGKNILPTEMGTKLIDILPVKELKSAQLTAEWEARLSAVENGQENIQNFTDSIQQKTTEWANSIKNDGNTIISERKEREVIGKCPRCGRNIYEGKKSFYCEGYKETPECSFSMFKDSKFFQNFKKTLTPALAGRLLQGKTKITGLTSSKSGKKFDAFVCIEDTGKYVNYNIIEYANKK